MKVFTAKLVHDVQVEDREWVRLVTKELENLSKGEFVRDGKLYWVDTFRGGYDEICLGEASKLDKAVFLVIDALKKKYEAKLA
jgi:hypothetical protein